MTTIPHAPTWKKPIPHFVFMSLHGFEKVHVPHINQHDIRPSHNAQILYLGLSEGQNDNESVQKKSTALQAA